MAEDGGEWREWLDRHGPGLVLFAKQWVSTRADAEDAVQDGFVRFWQARGRAKHEVAYLYSAVRSAAIDLSRSARRRQVRESGMLMGEPIPPSSFAAERAEFSAAVEAALAKLPCEQREVIVMKVWAGLTFAEIGKVVGITLNTAASRYRYALQHLEIELSAEVGRE